MFGYVKPFPPELKLKEYEAFRSVYCGLCHQLGKSFGPWARMTLNYDFVFLAMMYYASGDKLPTVCKHRCAVNPFKKVSICQSDTAMEFSADVAIIMMYYKAKDNIIDSGLPSKIWWSIVKKYIGLYWKKAVLRQPEVNCAINKMMEDQRKVEQSNSKSIDAACAPTANALSELMRIVNKDNLALHRIGYLIGRYIYLCDALEDMKKDRKTGNYNPFVSKYLSESDSSDSFDIAVESAKSSIYMTIGALGDSLDNSELTCFMPIVYNIIEFGLKNTTMGIIKKEGGIIDEESL